MSKFDYLLNAFERASQAPHPASEGYADKRRALLEYVEKIERELKIASPEIPVTSRPEERRSEDEIWNEAVVQAANICDNADGYSNTAADLYWRIMALLRKSGSDMNSGRT